MQLTDSNLFNAALDWAAHGLLALSWWQIVLCTLVLTHITMISVTVFLHRHQAHRALELHPIASHFFRFWLWMTTGMVTKEWAAVHRKHHAKCEQAEDPHSPQVYGLRTVLLRGAELYRVEATNAETLKRYGHGTPDDWMERHVYTGHSVMGVVLMALINLALFGVAGIAVWAVQMAWTPVMAAGVINGVGHFWGYRNFEAVDSSTNISPWGILIAGEELHNNHHTYPTSAKLSVKRFEFDIGWMYIRLMAALGLAQPKKTPPKAAFGAVRQVADETTLEALIANRYELMARYAKGVRQTLRMEVAAMRARSLDAAVIRAAKRWMHRDGDKVPASAAPELAKVRAASPMLDKMVTMREELRQVWLDNTASREQLIRDLQAWCQRAEASGIAALQEFSLKLRAARV
jgi:stearoyl-CoA desaturase (delta-9 desaturase)